MNDEEKAEKKKVAAEEKAAKKKAAAEEKAAKKKAAAEEKADKKDDKKAAGKYIGQELNVRQSSGAKFKGVCKGERETNSGAQVFIKLNSTVSRWFNVGDIAE